MSVAASRLVNIVTPVFLGLTPQANCLSSLRDLAIFVRCRFPGLAPQAMGIPPLRSSITGNGPGLPRANGETRLFDFVIRDQRRRRDRYLAWGVSPRTQEDNQSKSPEGATDTSSGA